MSKIYKLHAVADGKLISISEVSDFTFASKMLGNGYAIIPDNGIITSPIAGAITHIFPTNHVIGIQNDKLDILVHLGIGTVDLKGSAFENSLFEGQVVYPNSIISEVNLELIKENNMSSEMIVIFINKKTSILSFDLIAKGPVKRGQHIGYIEIA